MKTKKNEMSLLYSFFNILLVIVKISNVILFIALFLIITCLISLALADRYMIDSFFTSQLVNMIIEENLATGLFTPAIWIANLRLGNFIFFTIICLTIIILKTYLKIYIFKKIEHPFNKIIAILINLAINGLVFFGIIILFINILFVSYVNNTFDNLAKEQADCHYKDKLSLIKSHLERTNLEATTKLQTLMSQVSNKPDTIKNLSDEEYIKYAKEVSKLINLKGGVVSTEEHYFRNNFNRAPKDLDDMVKTIKSDNSTFKWHLVSPYDTLLHMYGDKGEYNLKFISENGLFEAVYNYNGVLLTKDNDPTNMGTFNYADFIKEPQKHSMYDVLPYLVWNNTKELTTIQDVDDSKFDENRDAQQRYYYYKEKLLK